MISKVDAIIYRCEYKDEDTYCYCVVTMKVDTLDDIKDTNFLARKLEKITGTTNTGSGYGFEGRDQNFEVSREKLPFFLGTLKSMFPEFSYKYDSNFQLPTVNYQ